VEVTKQHHVGDLNERAEELREYMQQSGIKSLINSLSGGVDSSTSAAISKLAAPSGAIGLMLPCSSAQELQGERRKDIVDGQRVADHLQMPAIAINLSDLWLQSVALLTAAAQEMATKRGEPLDQAKLDWAINNLKPTLRMMASGFFADAFQGLMVGTDNLIENFLGYFSIRGDGVADRQPIRDCTKAEVRALAASANYDDDLVGRTPTAGLWPGQTDEDELGFSYDQADRFVIWTLEQHLAHSLLDPFLTVRADCINWILAHSDLPVSVAVAQKIIAQNRRTAFKRKSDDLEKVLQQRRLI